MTTAAKISLGIAAFTAFTVLTTSGATGKLIPSVPAEFVMRLAPPGIDNQFGRPTALCFDRNHRELLVADLGHRRILIFDEHGTYRFGFGGGTEFPTPMDIAVDSQGFIYILGLTPGGRAVFRYDFDGTPLGEVALSTTHPGPSDLRSLALDSRDRLVLYDVASQSIRIHEPHGPEVQRFAIADDMSTERRQELVIGSIAVHHDEIYLPISSLGSVQVHDLEGNFLRAIGHRGNDIGELNFPVAVTVTEQGLVAILDKHRFNIVCFDLDGAAQGEFGGKGMREGWFYHPTLLESDGEGLIYVGQVFENMVQVCRIPDVVRTEPDPPREAAY